MNCETLRASLLELADGTLPEPQLAAALAHGAACPGCAHDLATWRATGQVLGELPTELVPAERLRQMAASALARSREGVAITPPAARAVLPRRRWPRIAAAAAILVAAALATDLALRTRAPTSVPPSDDAASKCLSDPDFVGDFDVLRDLADLSGDNGELLELDHEEVVMLQLFEDA